MRSQSTPLKVNEKKKAANQWWQRRPFWIAKGLIDLFLAYVFGSLAIDTGRYWFYIATLIFTWVGIWFIARGLKGK